jgi:Alw26I/Eco31I/Esp3I family type II restriction m6 adenine DNA methyltransferase
MAINFARTRERLKDFDFQRLFVEELGWSQPTTKLSTDMDVGGAFFTRRQISQLAGIAVFEVDAQDGQIPDAKTRAAIHKEISAIYHENLLIFIDKDRTQSLWYWVKREGSKKYPRDHVYIKGQPGDLFLGKLSGIVFELADFDERGNVSVLEVANRLRNALDVERVTKKFYAEFQDLRIAFLEHIKGIPDDVQRRWYASVLLNRLMFIYFLQRKGFIDKGDLNYLQNKLALSEQTGKDLFYSKFLKLLFFEGFAKPEEMRSGDAKKVLGQVKYLNGGLFLPHKIEQENPSIRVSDKAFENLFSLFQRYSWNLNDTPGGQDNEISPDILGYIFEKYINQKAFGAYYTRPEITEYLTERTIHRLILDAINTPEVAKKHVIKGVPVREYRSIAELLMNLDSGLCRELLFTVLPQMSLLDPACGSGAFLVAAMKALINVYAAVIGKIKFLGDASLTNWLGKVEREHKSISYFIKKAIITDNLYGVDIMEEGAEIARLRLFLALVAAAETVDQLEPLPNIDFNILAGNSLIGLMKVKESEFDKHRAQGNFFKRNYSEILAEKNRLIDNYRHAATYSDDLTSLRNDIEGKREEALLALNELLLDEFRELDIKYEQATWDDKKNKEGKSRPRPLKMADIDELQPFHWGYEFDQILNHKGGFDAIITNPPWETFRPEGREFFSEHSDLITKKKMELRDFEKELEKLLSDKEIKAAWLDYLSRFNHLRNYFRRATQYENQVPIIDGKRQATDVNLFKLFIEQCFRLLKNGGECGLVVPSGIYTDLGAKQLREMLYTQTKVTGLFCFENRKEIFENVHRSFKFVVLTFEKGGSTDSFPAAFMRQDVSELTEFPKRNSISIDLNLVRRLSPDSLSMMEFKSAADIEITEKMLKFPLLQERLKDSWSLNWHRELHMTDDAWLFHKERKNDRVPLYEGKMIWQFASDLAEPRFWIAEGHGRKAVLGESQDTGQTLGYQKCRLAYRAIASNTNERSLICSIIPPSFAGNSLNVSEGLDVRTQFFCVGILNSFAIDWFLRMKVTTNINMFYIYQLPVPRMTQAIREFDPIVQRASRLICTTPEFDELSRQVGMKGHKDGVTGAAQRASLRAELDGLVAHVYGLSEDEFAHILQAFPIVQQAEKDAALAAYKAFAPKTADQQILALIAAGESVNLEFKSSARWSLKENKADKAMEQIVVKTVASFLNGESGGTLLLGVDDGGNILGLENDYTLSGKKGRDSYENWLTTLLLGEFGKDASPLIHITFHGIGGKDICQLGLKSSPRPIFVKEGIAEHLYIRAGNSTRLLTSREAVEYCKQRWS